MTVAALARRIADLEVRRGRPPLPGVAPEWLRWAIGEEVDALEALCGEIETGARAATEIDRLRVIEIEAAATRRMLAGEAPS